MSMWKRCVPQSLFLFEHILYISSYIILTYQLYLFQLRYIQENTDFERNNDMKNQHMKNSLLEMHFHSTYPELSGAGTTNIISFVVYIKLKQCGV